MLASSLPSRTRSQKGLGTRNKEVAMHSEQRRRRSRRLTYSFRIVTLLLTLLLCEGALRLLTSPTFLQWPFPDWIWIVKDPVVGWKNGLNYFPKESKLPTFQINSYGFRGPEFTRLKHEGTKRIVCLGDSGTFGIWNDGPSESGGGKPSYNNDYPGRLAELLRKKGPANVEVINAGVIGYNSSHGLRQLKTELLDLNPDILTIRFGFNDHLQTWDRSLVPKEPENPFLRELYYYFLRWKLMHVALRAYQYVWYRNPDWNEGRWVSLERFESNLHRFAEISRAEGIHLLFLDYPLRPLFYGTRPSEHGLIARSEAKDLEALHRLHGEYQAVLRRVAQEEEVPLLETTENLHRSDPPRFGETDFVHPNNHGALALAKLLREKLITLGWIPQSEQADS